MIRFKNGGNGTTADGAILVANPDEFQDALNYVDPNASVNNKYIELEADLDLNYSADWYYRMTDIFNVNSIITTSDTADRKVVINGKNHAISNIYVYPNCAVFGTISGMSTHSSSIVSCMLEINDVVFEAILQKGAGFFSGSTRQAWPGQEYYRLLMVPRTNGCIFNVKMNIANVSLPAFDYSVNMNRKYPRAVNCIFNLYVSDATDDWLPMFYADSYSSSDYSYMTIFESCEFRIRNNTDKKMCIFTLRTNSNFLIDNCAIFFADIKQYDNPQNRTTSYDQGWALSRHVLGKYDSGSSYLGYLKALFYNSFVAAFGDDFNSGSNDPIWFWMDLTETNMVTPATSFYDSSKLVISMDSNPQTASGFTALTTAQCKDKTSLSNIGYLFAEEV